MILPHKPVRKEVTPSGILVSLVEDSVIKTLNELAKPREKQGELPPIEENLESDGKYF